MKSRQWIATPEMSDEAIRSGTGRGWDEWCDLIDQYSGRTNGHTAIVKHVRSEYNVGNWWSQAVTVGYERITGLRLPYQMADGTFTASKSRTVTIDATHLRRLLLDDHERARLFPGVLTKLSSKVTAKAIRIAIGQGIATISLYEVDGVRTKIAVEHAQLPVFDNVEEWKSYWADWLGTIDDVGI